MALVVVFTSCEKEEEPPVIPDISTFQMDFSEFAPISDTAKKSTSEEYSTYKHFVTSAFQITGWNIAVALVMATPVASFTESFNHEAVYHTDDKYWTWSYNFNLLGPHDAELKGYFEGDSVVWEMKIDTKVAYTGKNATDRSGGYWLLKKDLNSSDFWLQIDWNKNGDEARVKYTNILNGDHEKGGYILYGKTSGELNRYYHIFNKGANNLTKIEWNAEMKNGRIINQAVFGDNDWNCWNEKLRDIDCE